MLIGDCNPMLRPRHGVQVSAISSSSGMAIGVALVAAPDHSHGEGTAGTGIIGVGGEDVTRFRHGMLTALCIYVSFLFLPVWLLCRHSPPRGRLSTVDAEVAPKDNASSGIPKLWVPTTPLRV